MTTRMVINLPQQATCLIRTLVPALAIATVAFGAQTVPVHAATTITVTTAADEFNSNGKCSLREAIQAANTNLAVDSCPAGSSNDDDTIKLQSGIYKLTRLHQDDQAATTGDWNITSGIIIEGAGQSKTFIDADRKDRAFAVVDGRLLLKQATVRNGKVRDPYDNGGGILVKNGALLLNTVTIAGSDGFSGGGVYVDHDAVLSGSYVTVSANKAVQGGGIYSLGSITLNRQSSVKGNSTRTESPTDSNGNVGGGVYNLGEMYLFETTVENNKAAYGGGVLNSASSEFNVLISGSTISTNSAIDGAGIVNSSSTLQLFDSTISGNQAKNNGGGLHNNDYSCAPGCPGIAYLNNVTVTNNRADSDNNGSGDAGGIFNASYDAGNRVRFSNTILAKNRDSGNQAIDCAGSISSYGYNIVGSTKGCTIRNTSEGNKYNLDPKLGPLQNNGGLTKTHALYSGSPAIDGGSSKTPNNLDFSCTGYDQRGVQRPQDGNGDKQARCDIGAYERTPSGGKALATSPEQQTAPALQAQPTVEEQVVEVAS